MRVGCVVGGVVVGAGTAGTENWSLEFVHKGHWYNPLMGYTSTADPIGQLRMSFTSKQAAVAFAEKQGEWGGVLIHWWLFFFRVLFLFWVELVMVVAIAEVFLCTSFCCCCCCCLC